MNPQPSVALSHIGICTSSLERSLRFYTEALGFVLDRSIDEIGAPFDQLIELPGIPCRVHYVKSGGVTIELIGYPGSGVSGSGERKPMNRLGFTHMTLIVDDLDAVAARVEQFGGQLLPQTRIDSPYGPIMFCTDPDGVRIELFQAAG